jgi:hypothetical protein
MYNPHPDSESKNVESKERRDYREKLLHVLSRLIWRTQAGRSGSLIFHDLLCAQNVVLLLFHGTEA